MTPSINTAALQNYFATQPIIRAWLFGSYSDGTADENSDVDILVELDYSQYIGLNFVGIWLDLKALLQKEVDLVPADCVSKFVKPYIEKQKILIYERENRR